MMASEQSPSQLANSPTFPETSSANQRTNNAINTKSLKRKRTEHSNDNFGVIVNDGLRSPTPLGSPRFFAAYSTDLTAINDSEPEIMTEQRQDETHRNHTFDVTESCRHGILSTLMASDNNEVGKPQDVPTAVVTATEEVKLPENFITIPNAMGFEDKLETSSTTPTSLVSLRNMKSPLVPNDSTSVVSKSLSQNTGSRDIDQSQESTEELLSRRQSITSEGVLIKQVQENGTVRSVSLQNHGQQVMLRPPSLNKHKCPYCETQFTRHHNLKSHLLTHSQEKPYTCQTCAMKFRRLHDLKRHTKLHTGERPHTCQKCDRKFARADALARHTKGQGGCAGRRASIGSFGGDDNLEGPNPVDRAESAMHGVMYGNGSSHHENEINEEEQGKLSLPSMQTKHVFSSSNGDVYASPRISNSYTSTETRLDEPHGGPHTPSDDRVNSVLLAAPPHVKDIVLREYTSGTSLSSSSLNTGGSVAFAQNVMIESPNSSSSTNMHSLQSDHETQINEQRSPITDSQYSPHLFGRQQSNKLPTPGMPVVSSHEKPIDSKLSSLTALAPTDQRLTDSRKASNKYSAGKEVKANSVTSNAAISSGKQNSCAHLNQGGIDGNNNNLFASAEKEVWAYVQTLEDKVKQLSDKMQRMEKKEKSQEDKINQLSLEVFSLRTQLNTSNPSLNLNSSS